VILAQAESRSLQQGHAPSLRESLRLDAAEVDAGGQGLATGVPADPTLIMATGLPMFVHLQDAYMSAAEPADRGAEFGFMHAGVVYLISPNGGIMRAMRLRLALATLVLMAATAAQAQIAHGYSNVFVLDTVTALDDAGSPPPATAFLSIYPNPFNPRTTIEFSLAEAGVVELAVFDLHGRLIRELDNEYRSAGRYRVTWSGQDGAGHVVPAGAYFFKLIAAGESRTAKVTMVK